MSRGLRFLPVNSIVHCVNRGNDKRVLFERARNFEDFLRLVTWAKAKCPVRILAYCVMSNHWHFVFWISELGDVSRFLHRLTTTHAVSWRRRTLTVGEGHVYGDRFHDAKVYSEAYYYNVIRYVEQNPLRANLVHASRDWRWSSLQERLGDARGIIEDGPLAMPTDWPAIVDEGLSEDALHEIRSSLQRY
jgi:REP-associated tyrosine transposase